jgi:hypothetical protein
MSREVAIQSVTPPRAVDPVPPSKGIRRAARGVLSGGFVLAALGSMLMGDGPPPADLPPVVEACFALFLTSLPLSGGLWVVPRLIDRRRLERFERRAGFLPRRGRADLPASGRTTLYRLEYGWRDEWICVMVARWEYKGNRGWQRHVLPHEYVWVDASDAVALGTERARLSELAERLEEEADTARLEAEEHERFRRLEAQERARIRRLEAAERRARRERAARLVEELARDPR